MRICRQVLQPSDAVVVQHEEEFPGIQREINMCIPSFIDGRRLCHPERLGVLERCNVYIVANEESKICRGCPSDVSSQHMPPCDHHQLCSKKPCCVPWCIGMRTPGRRVHPCTTGITQVILLSRHRIPTFGRKLGSPSLQPIPGSSARLRIVPDIIRSPLSQLQRHL